MTAIAKKIPALRFPDFEGEWIRERLGTVFEIFNGYAFSSANACEEGVKWVKIADVGINQMRYDNLSYLPGEFIKKHKKFLLKKGDYVIALTRPILSGNLKIAQINDDFDNSLLNQRVGKILSNNDLGFVYNLLQRRALIVQIENNIAGTDPPNLSPSAINTIKAFIPTLPEQQKIATFLTTIDTRIQQLSRKKALLEQYKKGVMQQLFSQEIRFKDEEGKEFPAWEEKFLEDIASFVDYRGKSPIKTEQGIFLVTAKNIKLGYIDYQSSQEFVNPSDYHEIMRRGYPKIGDILFTTEAPLGNVAQIDREDIALAQRVIKLRATPENDNTFLKHLMLGDEFQQLIHSKAIGSTVVGIQGKVLRKLRFLVPSLLEQQKIATFLSTLDRQINLVSQQLERMQTFKKGLLQQMFV